MIFPVLLIAGGLVLLISGAHGLVRGSSALALKLGISPLVVGLTVVAFGTSSPELLVSLNAASIGEGSLAVGNIVGSNIANIALILGVGAIIIPLHIRTQVVRLDLPIVIACSFLLLYFLVDGALSRTEGLILTVLIVTYLVANYVLARRERAVLQPVDVPRVGWAHAGMLSVGGLILLLVGSHILLQGALELAEQLLISTAFVGLTVVAVGTSLPELATTVAAALQKNVDVAVGTALGSNIINILALLGIPAFIYPMSDIEVGWPSLWVMTGIAVLALPLLKSGFTLSRREGVALLLIYATYLTYLFLDTATL